MYVFKKWCFTKTNFCCFSIILLFEEKKKHIAGPYQMGCYILGSFLSHTLPELTPEVGDLYPKYHEAPKT